MADNHIFLGFDCSTQSFRVIATDISGNALYTDKVVFSTDLPNYITDNGIHKNEDIITSPVTMWVEAFELLLLKMEDKKFPFKNVRAISGSAQQHACVFWHKLEILKNLSVSTTLTERITDILLIKNAAIWMDSSTKKQCCQFETALGGAQKVAEITGSRAYERFSGMQIKKIYQETPSVYKNTERISLLSSFFTSILIQDYADIDYSDAAGMNLMDIKTKDWSTECLDNVAPNLATKLGNIKPSHEVAGKIGSYFVERYGFDKETCVIYWSGDNPNSLAGLQTDNIAINLGTSDTVFGITDNPQPNTFSHIFPNPIDPTSYMVMLCFKNGALTRESIKQNVPWTTFDFILSQTCPGNEGNIGFYFNFEEITPLTLIGHYEFDINNKETVFDIKTRFRALIEGQFLTMSLFSDELKFKSNRIVVSGGGSTNTEFLELISSIFNSSVSSLQNYESSLIGAAYRAAHGYLCFKNGKFIDFNSMFNPEYDKTYLPNLSETPIYTIMKNRIKTLHPGLRHNNY